MTDTRAIDELAERETKLFHQRASTRYLLCAIELMCVDFSPNEVVAKLRNMADHLEINQ